MPVVSNVKFANFFRSHIKGTVAAGDTLIDIVSTSGLPALVDSDDYFYLVLHRLNDNASEIVKVTGVTGTCLTVIRAQEGTTALTYAHGDRIELWVTAGLLADLYAELSEQNKEWYANCADGVDHGDVTVDNSVAKLIADGAKTIHLVSNGANGGEFEAATNVAVPADVTLVFEDGAFIIGDSATWTLNGQVIAGPTKIFDRATVTFSSTIQPEVYVQWWMTAFRDDVNLNDISDALVAAAATDKAVRLVGDILYQIAQTVVVGGSVVRFDPGARINVQGGNTLTMGFEIEAGTNQHIFTGNGIFVNSDIRNDRWYAAWAGAPGDNTDGAEEIDRLVNEIMGGAGTIVFPRTNGGWRFSDDVTIPSSVSVVIDNGAKLKISAADILTINGPVLAGPQEIFEGLGTITGLMSRSIVFPEWFAATVTNTTPYVATPVGNIPAPPGSLFPHILDGVADLFVKRAGTGSDGWYPSIGVGSLEFADGDTTPSVRHFKTFKTANTGATVITNFDDGFEGQAITIHIEDDETTIDFTAPNLIGNNGFAIKMKTGDVLYATRDSAGAWRCTITDNNTSGWDWDSGWTDMAAHVVAGVIDLDATGSDSDFSDVGKSSGTTGVTPATGTCSTQIPNIGANDPGYRDSLIMVRPKDDAAGGPFVGNYVTLAAANHFFDDNGFGLRVSGSKLYLVFSDPGIEWVQLSPAARTALGGWPQLFSADTLMRIKLRRS